MPNPKTVLQKGKPCFQELLCTGSVDKHVYTVGVSQYGSNGADTGVRWSHVPNPSTEWQPASQVSIPFLQHESALLPRKGTF